MSPPEDKGTGGSNLGEYDWSSEENAGKWRGLFVSPLHKVLNQVHPQFTAKEDALEYVENLLIKLLAMLTAKPVPVSVSDVEVLYFIICLKKELSWWFFKYAKEILGVYT